MRNNKYRSLNRTLGTLPTIQAQTTLVFYKLKLVGEKGFLSISEPSQICHSIQVYQIRSNDYLDQKLSRDLKFMLSYPSAFGELFSFIFFHCLVSWSVNQYIMFSNLT